MNKTRQEILDYLQRRHKGTVDELSRALSMTRPNIRHHLSILASQGLVEEVGQLPQAGRGRPTLVYMLSAGSGRQGLEQLVEALLDEVNAERNERAHQQRLVNIAARLQRDEIDTGQPVTLRLNTAVQRLNQLHYRAHWEAHAGGPQVILGQCPYTAILARHPELCQIDRHLLQALSGRPVLQVEKAASFPEGPHTCWFTIQ